MRNLPKNILVRYDQSQIAKSAIGFSLLPSTFFATAQAADEGKKMLRDLAADILEYVDRDLRDPSPSSGGFWSAEDADSKETFDVHGKSIGK